MLRAKRRTVTIKRIEGKDASSSGSFRYMATKRINREKAIFMVTKISRTKGGSGTIISAMIVTKRNATKKSLAEKRDFNPFKSKPGVAMF